MPNKLSSLCITAVLPAMMYAQNTIQVNTKGIPEFGLSLTSAVNSGLSPGSDLTLQTLWPYTVVLSNSSNRPIVSYTISWSYLYPDGRVTNNMAKFVRPLALMDGTRSRAARTSIVIGSSKRLISPMFDVSPSSPGDLSRLLIRARKLDNNLRTAQALTVTLDAAVFEDGTLVGPDDDNLSTRLSAQVNAEQDLYQSILGDTSDTDLTSLISGVPSTKPAAAVVLNSTSGYQTLYNFFRAQALQELVSVNSHSGLTGVRTLAQVKLYTQRPSIKKQ